MDRRLFLKGMAMTIGAAPLGALGCLRAAGSSTAESGVPRELAAIIRAPECLNSPHLTAEDVAGKVVLADFCTYTCINWLRTLPYIRAWARKYPQLVVVGVHTPEFGFEANVDNVRRAIKRIGVDYPIVIDNDYAIWRAFENDVWPAVYLMDARGRVRHHRFGEGDYPSTERVVQQLLKEAGVSDAGNDVIAADGSGIEAAAQWPDLRSPETYIGYERTENFASPGGARLDRRHPYREPSRLALNQWALSGEWTIGRQATVLNGATGKIAYRFHARDVHLVMGPAQPGTPRPFRVSIDGAPPGSAHGLDVDESGRGTVAQPRLYQLVRQSTPIADRQFEIEFLEGGVEAYSFTFG